MNAKHSEVIGWLESIFGGDNVPQYEVDTFTVDRLYQLKKKNEESDYFGNIQLEDIQEKRKEYMVEAERLGEVLDNIGLLPGALSQSGTVSLRSVANAAVILEVADASDTNLLLATSELSQKSMKVAEERRMEQRLSSQLFSKTKAARIQANNLERALAGLEEQARSQGSALQDKARQAEFLTTKSKQYKREIQELKKKLVQNKVDPSVYHSALLKKSEELKTIKDELLPMKAKLNSYHQLPPDMSLARVKVEETRRELEQIEEDLSKRINLMHM